MIIFGLMSFSQAGYFVIRYFTLHEPIEAAAQSMLLQTAWRSYWLFMSAALVQMTWRQFIAKRWLVALIVFSFLACLASVLFISA